MGTEIVRKTTCDICGIEVPVVPGYLWQGGETKMPPMPASWALITIQRQSEKELRAVLCPECALETTTQLTRHLGEVKVHTHIHTHEVTFGGRLVHEDIRHSHPHSKNANEHHHYTEEAILKGPGSASANEVEIET